MQGGMRTKKKSHRLRRARFNRYINDFWNICDVLSYLVLLVALIGRHAFDENHVYPGQGDDVYPWQVYPWQTARRIYSASLFIMYIRYLQCFLMHKVLGPTLIMIKQMVCSPMYIAANVILILISYNIGV